jgi:hypothetical protein
MNEGPYVEEEEEGYSEEQDSGENIVKEGENTGEGTETV